MDVEITPFWNKKNLEPPTIKSLKIICKFPDKISASLAEILENITSVLSDQDLLHHDAALISRLLFRTKMTLRNNKGYKCFQKVKRCLRSYLTLDLLSSMSSIRHTAYGANGPSKEVLEWGLLNLQRFSTLFHRLQNTCLEAAYYMHNHIKNGNNWHLALLFLACLSRVWTISRFLILQACEWYITLKPFLKQLQSCESWLPSDYELPADLKSWLKNPDYLHSPKTDKPLKQGEKEENLDYENLNSKNISAGLTFNEDFGEVISRTTDSPLDSRVKKSEVILQKCEDIIAFVNNEQRFRQSKNSKSNTKNLSDTEWKYLRSYLKKTYVELKSTKNRNIYEESLKRAQRKLNIWIMNVKNS